MSFVRRKIHKGRAYLYLVKNHREGKKVVQKVIQYLGPDPDG